MPAALAVHPDYSASLGNSNGIQQDRGVGGLTQGSKDSQRINGMLAPWVLEELKTADLEDKRLNKRFMQLVNQLSKHPNLSIPAACGGEAEMAAAYRWFDNEKVTFDLVLQPHIDATRKRVAAQLLVLLAQDTTEVDVTRP